MYQKKQLTINNTIYDLTDYIQEHPGGEELIEEFIGKDATKAYYDVGHSKEANQILEKLKIGTINNNNYIVYYYIILLITIFFSIFLFYLDLNFDIKLQFDNCINL